MVKPIHAPIMNECTIHFYLVFVLVDIAFVPTYTQQNINVRKSKSGGIPENKLTYMYPELSVDNPKLAYSGCVC